MSPRPDRRPDSRPERGARRPGGGPSGRPPGRGPGAPMGAGGNRRPRWGAPEGAGPDRARPGRDAGRPMGEWTPRGPGADSAGPRRGEGSRFSDRRPERPERSERPGRPEFGRPEERRWERRSEDRRPAPGGRFDRRPEAGRPPRPTGARPAGARPSGPRPSGPRPSGPRPSGPRGLEGGGAPRFLPRGGARPRPPAELMGLERRGPAGGAGRPAESPEGENFAGAAPSDLIWGRHSAQAALESGRPIHRIWCTPEMRFSPRFLQLLREAKASGVLVEEVTWARLGQISGGAVHQGIVLQPAAAETLDLASLIEGCRSTGESPLLMAVDGLTDPQNLGAIVRSAEALGAHGLVLPQRRNAGLTGSVAKVAAGALEHLPVARVVNLNRSLETLKDEGYRVIGLASEGSITLEEADLEGPLVVVTGSEGDGLSLLTRRHCDQLVRIPLRGTTPSLNASVATALLLYEIARRGWMQGLRGNSPAPRLVRPALPAPAAADASVVAAENGLAEPVPAPAAEELPAADVPEQNDAMPAAAGPDAQATSVWHAAIAAEPMGDELQDPTPSSEPLPEAVAQQPVPGTIADSGAATPVQPVAESPASQPSAQPWSAAALSPSEPASGVSPPEADAAGLADPQVLAQVSAERLAADAEPHPTGASAFGVDAPPADPDAGLSFQGDIRL